MAKTKSRAKPRAKPREPASVVVNYNLYDLPTAFHKAGLAGLAMLIESLKDRGVLNKGDGECAWTATDVNVTFTHSLVQKLMDEIYDARIVEVAVKSKWQGAQIKREDTVEENDNGKITKSKRFVYDVVQPLGTFLRDKYSDGDGLWLKLWRDVMWNIVRARPTTREPYNQRAAGHSCKEGATVWAELLKVEKAHATKGSHTADISSALWPGVQAMNAESVAFKGPAEQILLLHFWPLTALLFVPQQVEVDGSTDFVGYTLAIPEVANIVDFIHDYSRLLNELPTDARGYRPAGAVIDLPAEGALSFLDHLAIVAKLQIESGELRYSVGGVEYMHLVKPKSENNVKTRTSGRISPNRKLLTGYRSIVDPKAGLEPRFRNALFRRGLLLALLNNDPWYRPFGRTLANFDSDIFFRNSRRTATPDEKGPPQFANDVARKFQYEAGVFFQTVERTTTMPEVERPESQLPMIINRVVRNYVLKRTEDKTGIKLAAFGGQGGNIEWEKIPAEFNEAKQKLAQSLFLEFRSRKEQAFVDHFAATFFSVTQRIAEADRLELANVLTSQQSRDDLKTLTLLSLSANS